MRENLSDDVRQNFRKLSLDEKTSFLVEAVFSTAYSAVNEIGERVSSLVDLLVGGKSDEPVAEEAEPEEATPKPEPAKQKARSSRSTSSKSSSRTQKKSSS
jgi:hypothetical protein